MVLYLITWLIVRKNTEDPWVIKLIILMVLSCLGGVGVTIGNLGLVADPPPDHIMFYVYLQAISGFIRDTGFNVSHWMFAYQYLTSAVEMPYILDRSEMPEARQRRFKVFYILVMVINVVDIICYYVILCYMNVIEISKGIDPLENNELLFYGYTFTRYMVGAL